jgi:lipopolysaccharide assembly protein A
MLRQGGSILRWFYVAVICVRGCRHHLRRPKPGEVTMSFLGFSARVPLALLAAGIYLLGTVTGGSLLALLRQSIEGAKRRKVATS